MSTAFSEMTITDDIIIEMTDLSGNVVAAFSIPEDKKNYRLSAVHQFFNGYEPDMEQYCLIAPNGSRFDGPFKSEGCIESFGALYDWYKANCK